jgi:methionine aminotransferase
MIMLNSPHNPTGSVLSSADMQELRSIVEGTGIFILSDEVYEHLVFNGRRHESMLRYPDLMERSFICFSFGKVYNCTGWKLGYCIAPEAFTNEFRKVHQFNCFSCNMPMQAGLAAFLQNEEAYLQLGMKMQQKQQYFQELMSGTALKPLPTLGSYFQLYKYDQISEEADSDFAIRITKEYGVAAIPISVLYNRRNDNKVVRFCFAKKEETLDKAVEKLSAIR